MLSQEQMDFYRERGILFPIEVLTSDELNHYRRGFEEVNAYFDGNPHPNQLRHWQLHFRWAWDLAVHPKVLDIVEQILGPNILVHSATMFVKQPHDRKYVSWHQDGHYWGLDAPLSTSAWIALTDSTPDRGCMRVVPYSHQTGRLPHGETSRSVDNMLGSGIEVAGDVDEAEAVDVSLRAGEISLHHVDMVHGSKANESDWPRIGYAVRFMAPQIKQSIPHHKVILARGADEFGHFDTSAQPPDMSLEEGAKARERFMEDFAAMRAGTR
jgi:non-heme Fe2+,alpha-ketoglutarate-dependent halogenase